MKGKLNQRRICEGERSSNQSSKSEKQDNGINSSQNTEGTRIPKDHGNDTKRSGLPEYRESTDVAPGEELRLRDVVDLVNLLLPPLLLILLHVAGLSFTTMFLVCTATVICLMEYIAWWGGGG